MKETSIKQIANQRIAVLFKKAQQVARADPELASQYVLSARRIAMAAKIRMPVEFRRRTCRECNALFVHAVNVRVRVKQKREPHVVITCLNCGNQTRIMLRKKEQKEIEHEDNDTNETPRAARIER